MLQVGDKAPDMTLQDQRGASRTLSELWAKGPMVLYFYPKDETMGCTAEACSFRDSYEAFTDAGAEVVGVSRDGVTSHASFASHHRLPFVLLADPGGGLRERFGVKKTFGFIDGRVTFVIDREGVVRHVFNSQVLATAHVGEALGVVKRLAADRQGT